MRGLITHTHNSGLPSCWRNEVAFSHKIKQNKNNHPKEPKALSFKYNIHTRGNTKALYVILRNRDIASSQCSVTSARQNNKVFFKNSKYAEIL